MNLQLQHNCLYVPLASLTNMAGRSNVNGLTGLVRAGTNLYGTITDGREVCYSISTRQACPGQPYATNTPPNNDRAGLGPYDFYGSKTVVANRVYTTSNATFDLANHTRPHPPTLTCFDPATNTTCTGWTTPKVTTASPRPLSADAIYAHYDYTGFQTGVCTTTTFKTDTRPLVSCYDFAGNTTSPPRNLDVLYPTGGRLGQAMTPLTTPRGGQLHSCFPYYTGDGTHRGITLCYSWTTQAPCGGFPNPAHHPTVNGGVTKDYGYAYDGNCLYGNGDAGYLFSLHPDTAIPGC